MALLRRIDARDRYWRMNRQPYVEPTEDQKIIAQRDEEARRKRLRKAEMELAAMFGTIEALCPGIIDKSMRISKLFK